MTLWFDLTKVGFLSHRGCLISVLSDWLSSTVYLVLLDTAFDRFRWETERCVSGKSHKRFYWPKINQQLERYQKKHSGPWCSNRTVLTLRRKKKQFHCHFPHIHQPYNKSSLFCDTHLNVSWGERSCYNFCRQSIIQLYLTATNMCSQKHWSPRIDILQGEMGI